MYIIGDKHTSVKITLYRYTETVQRNWQHWVHTAGEEDKHNKTHNTICVRHHRAQDTRRRKTKQKTQHNMCWTPPYTGQKTKTNNTKSTTQYVLDTTIHRTEDEDKQYKKHNPICVGHQHTQDRRRRQTIQKAQTNMCWTPTYTGQKTKTNNTKSTTQYVLDTNIHRTQDEDKQYKKHNPICVGHQHTQDRRRRQTIQKAQPNMCWTPTYTGQKTKTNNTKSTTQYVLDTTIHSTQDEDKQYKKLNPICVGHQHTQDRRRRQTIQKAQPNMCWTPTYTGHKMKTNNTKTTTQYVLDTNIHRTEDEDKQYKKHNPICVGHLHTQDTRRRQTIQKAQPNMCWTPTYTGQKTKTNNTKSTTQYVLDTTMHSTQDEDKQYKKHNPICVGHHHTQHTRRRQTIQKAQPNMCWTPTYTGQKTKTNNTKSTTQYVLDTNIHSTHDEEKQYKKHNPICVGHHHTQHTRRRQTIQKAQPNMCWTPTYTGQKTKTNNTKSTTQYMLDTTIHSTQDEDKQYKKHNPICVGHQHTQDTICVGHQHTQHTRRRQTIQKAQPNMCWTPTYTAHNMCWTPTYTAHNMCWTPTYTAHNMCWTPTYTAHKTKTNNTKSTTQYVLDTNIRKTQDEDKQ